MGYGSRSIEVRNRIVDIRPDSFRTGTGIMNPELNYSTSLGRHPEEFRVLGQQLAQKKQKKLRLLQVGIGRTFVGETLELLDMLEKIGKPYELVSMDVELAVVLRHLMETRIKVEGFAYHLSTGMSTEELEALISGMKCAKNTQKIPVRELWLSDKEFADFTFDVPQEIRDKIVYVIGDVARDRLPNELEGFDAVICMHTLYQLAGKCHVDAAIRNMLSYLNPGGLLAIDSGRRKVSEMFATTGEREFGLERIFGPPMSEQTELECGRIYRLNS